VLRSFIGLDVVFNVGGGCFELIMCKEERFNIGFGQNMNNNKRGSNINLRNNTAKAFL
jgi:hypothetical protein